MSRGGPSRRRGGGAGRAPGGGLGGGQIEGRRAVEELLAARRRRVRDVWVAEGSDPSPALERIVALASSARVPVRWVGRAQIEREAWTDSHQGVLAHADEVPDADLDELAASPEAFLVALEGVTDPHNVGAVMRSAECAGATGIILARHRAVGITPTVAKAAAGAVEHLPMAVVPGIPGALQSLARAGVWTVGLDVSARASLFDLELADRPVALVLGAEDRGLSRLARTRCDLLVSIPRHGALGSLNVSAAAALACFEVARRRHP